MVYGGVWCVAATGGVWKPAASYDRELTSTSAGAMTIQVIVTGGGVSCLLVQVGWGMVYGGVVYGGVVYVRGL